VNAAPIVSIEQPNWNATTGSAVIITGVSINDTDASYFKETFLISLTKADGSPAAAGSFLDLIAYSESRCDHRDNTTVCYIFIIIY
jgi:hypothetical protein